MASIRCFRQWLTISQKPGRLSAGAYADWPSSTNSPTTRWSGRSSTHRFRSLRCAGIEMSFRACSSEETRQ